ncbi:MAG: Fe-S cluster assembly protein SufD [Paludibacteraceae bacterium]|nr:Fe-S cluster assembly protein SufD [Paludibacteraceae bacterium]
MILKSYIDLYRSAQDRFNAGAPDWLVEARRGSLDFLQQHGSLREAAAYATDYGMNPDRLQLKEDPYKLFSCAIPEISAYNYLVVNDSFCIPGAAELPQGVVVTSLAKAFSTHPEWVKRYFGLSHTDSADWHFNQLFAQDGLFIYVPQGVVLDQPVQLVNYMYDKEARMAVSHNLIVVEDGAAAQVLVCDHAWGETDYLSNRYTEVYVGKGAKYEHYKLESTNEHMTNISTLAIDQQAGSQVLTNSITLHGGHTDNRVQVRMLGEGARLSLNGLALGTGRQRISNHTDIRHQVAGAMSSELFKYLLDQAAQGDFYGLIRVDEGADRTTALQTNRNLCLSADARMQARPQLEIYADDVQCNHGSATGQLDENALFYMQTRGISEVEARHLLMSAFAYEVLNNIGIEKVKDRLRLMIDRRLRGEKYNCHACSMCQ